MAGVSLLSAALAGAGEAMKHSSTATVAPILVNCVPSDGSEGGSISAWRRSSSSSAGGAASVAAAITKQHSCEPDTATEAVPATRISQADVQAGNFKTGVRYCIETWPQSKLLLALDTLLAMSSMFGYTATLVIIPTLAALAWVLPWQLPAWGVGSFVAFLLVSVFMPAEPLLWEGFQNSTLVSSWRRYFQFSFALESKLDQHGRYIFAGFPHGVFPVSELLCISLMMRLWPALRVYSIAASSVFSVPVWRHIMCWTGARPATRHWFRWLLARGSVSLVPGGIAEMFLWEAGREVIKARDRKGFVRLAVEAGVPLVPVYHFGNSQLFSWVAPRSWEVIARRTRTAVGYPRGRWGTFMPNNAPLFMAVGAPIPVPKVSPGDPGYADAVDAAHAALVDALVALYDKYKGQYGWQQRPLLVT